MKRHFLALSLVALLCVPALASDPISKNRPIPEQLFNWSGFYVGGHVGHGSVDGSGSVFGASYSPSPEGWFYGGHVGAQKQLGGLVLGVEGSISKGSSLAGSSGISGAPGLTAHYDINFIATGEVKAGLALGRWLPHLTGGVACGEGSGTVSGGGAIGSSKTWHCGPTFGVGTDYALAPNLILTGRVNWTDLGNAQVSFPVGGGLGVSTPLSLEGYTAKLGASLRF